MRSGAVISIFVLLVTVSCVDRVFFDIPLPASYGVSIGGYISDQPGPYQVSVFRTFDIESNDATKTGVSTRSVMILDNEGNSETLTQVQSGVYETDANGMRGKIGGVYKIRVELLDGRVYESRPDTLKAGGDLDKIYYKLRPEYYTNGVRYVFDVFADASVGGIDLNATHFMWVNRTTHKSLTHPENEPSDPMNGGQCYRDPLEHKCNYKDPCSGLKNIGSDFAPNFVRIKECECCYCWYDRYNETVVLNDKLASVEGVYNTVTVDHVPMTGWMMMYKARFEVSFMSISSPTYEFWKAVRDQHTAVSNIFQPITGRIRGNIQQVSGTQEPAEGIFYATSISRKEFYILRENVPEYLIPTTKFPHSDDFSCLKLMPGSTAVKPSFWQE